MEEGLPKIPKLELAQIKFTLLQETTASKNNTKTSLANNITQMREKLLAEIVKDS